MFRGGLKSLAFGTVAHWRFGSTWMVYNALEDRGQLMTHRTALHLVWSQELSRLFRRDLRARLAT